MERGEISLTYACVMPLAQGLRLDLGGLFDAQAEGFALGTITVTHAGEAPMPRSATRDYEMLTSGVIGNHMVPMVGRINAHSFATFEKVISQSGRL
ncbi:hypothetical protein [Ruegeria pomeroyi]|nr:hypothetical protein [Ruegeria pomeroyi]